MMFLPSRWFDFITKKTLAGPPLHLPLFFPLFLANFLIIPHFPLGFPPNVVNKNCNTKQEITRSPALFVVFLFYLLRDRTILPPFRIAAEFIKIIPFSVFPLEYRLYAAVRHDALTSNVSVVMYLVERAPYHVFHFALAHSSFPPLSIKPRRPFPVMQIAPLVLSFALPRLDIVFE